MWEPGRWTPLFFWDEAVALAAGHRPCALCRHCDFVRWMDGWEAATGERPKVDPVDRVLHEQRTGPPVPMAWRDLPVGAFVVVDDIPHLVLDDRLVPWRPIADGYGAPGARPGSGRALVLTPRATVAVLAAGYEPVLNL